MNPMNVVTVIIFSIWLVTNSISLGLLHASLKELFETVKLAKALQDKTNTAIQDFLRQINKDIDSLQDRVAELEKQKGQEDG